MQPQSPISAWIALGSNLGEREANLRRALDLLAQTPDIRLLRVSSFLDNPAVGGPQSSPPFLNAAASLQTTLSPHDLLARLLQIEQQMGRVRLEKWGPRIIDLDLLLYADQILNTPTLTLPHPLMHERYFVLHPLAEIAPDIIHPVMKKSIATLLKDLPTP